MTAVANIVLHQKVVRKHAFKSRGADAPERCLHFRPLAKQRAQGMPGAQCTRSLMRALG